MAYLEIVKKGARIINVDESALTYMDFTRKLWAKKKDPHSIRVRTVNPRVSLIMAIDNHGKVYASLTNVNTDATIMSIYMKELVKTLDAEDVNWRRYTLILHDGAAYCRSTVFNKAIKDLHVPFMMSAPHSYNISWVELLFGSIKTGVLNPEDMSLGKSNFLNIVKMIVEKVKSIAIHHRILMYHHCLCHVLRFLLLQKL